MPGELSAAGLIFKIISFQQKLIYKIQICIQLNLLAKKWAVVFMTAY